MPQVRGQPELHSETLRGKREGMKKGEKSERRVKSERKQCSLRDSHGIIAVLKQSSIHLVQYFKEYLSCIDRPPSTDPIVHNVCE